MMASPDRRAGQRERSGSLSNTQLAEIAQLNDKAVLLWKPGQGIVQPLGLLFLFATRERGAGWIGECSSSRFMKWLNPLNTAAPAGAEHFV